jgi:hypothetical protein
MSIYIASIPLLIIGAAYAIMLKRKLAETFFLAVVTVTGVLYCFGLINHQGCLLYGIYSIVALSVAGVLVLLYTFMKYRQNFYGAELLKGCFIYACFLMFALFINYGRTFHLYDEFTHWGTIVKHFYIVDALGTVGHTNYAVDFFWAYFPGTSLFQYYFSRFSNEFTEYYSYIGMNVMYLSLVMPFIKSIFRKESRAKAYVLLAVFFVMPLTASVEFYSSLYVDVILGSFFGFSLLYYFAYKYEESLYGVLMVSAAIFLLTLTKDMGLLFSTVVIGIIATDIIFFKRIQIESILHKKAGLIYKIKKNLLLLSPIISSLFVKISWSNTLNRSNIRSIWHIPTMDDIYKFFFGPLEQYQKEVRFKFFNAMFKRGIPYLNKSVATFSIIFFVVILFISLLNNKKIEFRRMMTSTLLLVIGLFGYQFILALMYVFSFHVSEAPRLASYERYTSTYMLAMTLFITIFYVIEQNGQTKMNLTKLKKLMASKQNIRYKNILNLGRYFLYGLTSVVLFITVMNISKIGIFDTLLGRLINSQSLKPRPTAIAAKKWKPYFENENPYFITQEGGDILSYAMMQYDLIPYSALAGGGSISTGTSYYAGDIRTRIISPEEWEKYVLTNGYKLLYIYKSDEILETIYGHFFRNGVQEDMCYYVQNEEGRLVLVPVVE